MGTNHQRAKVTLAGLLLLMILLVATGNLEAAAYSSIEKDANGNPVTVSGMSLNGVSEETREYTNEYGDSQMDITLSFAELEGTPGPTIKGRVISRSIGEILDGKTSDNILLVVYDDAGNAKDVQEISVTYNGYVVNDTENCLNSIKRVDIRTKSAYGKFTSSNEDGHWAGCGVGVPCMVSFWGDTTPEKRTDAINTLKGMLSSMKKTVNSAANQNSLARIAYKAAIEEFIQRANELIAWSPLDKAEVEKLIAETPALRVAALEALGFMGEARATKAKQDAAEIPVPEDSLTMPYFPGIDSHRTVTSDPGAPPAFVTKDGMTEKLHEFIVDAMTIRPNVVLRSDRTSELIGAAFPKTVSGGSSAAKLNRRVIEVTPKEITSLRKAFQSDSNAYNEYKSQTDHINALKIAFKWLAIGKDYPDHISIITENCASAQGYADFFTWIRDIIKRDMGILNLKVFPGL